MFRNVNVMNNQFIEIYLFLFQPYGRREMFICTYTGVRFPVRPTYITQ